MNQRKLQQNGLTLIELLIVIALIGILGLAILGLQYIIGQNQIVAWDSFLSVSEANTSISLLTRELRTARDGENGSYALASGGDTELIFYSDIDFDGTVERVRYFHSGSEFSKGTIEPQGFPITYPQEEEKVKVLSDNVRNGDTPVFSYYNGDWPEDTDNNPLSTPATPSDVKLIKIYLKLGTRRDDSDKVYELESFAQLRMLKDNL